ncbi:phage capsid protein [Bradyrhizobium sp. 188]|uniref:phage capsid protein n=1 Tax=Bradyrhizobium sp. 188 TaxID=2782656 RepID=UPI001FFB4489|nr:hypothetical protein [Bradyrhizobium sp. 188]
MSDTAFQVQYRQEAIMGFEQGLSMLGSAVTTEAEFKGNQATFLVADSGGAVARTRGVNGLIPSRADNLNQYTATLVENHDLVRRTGFNIFASQGDGRRIMQDTSRKVINKAIDQDILAELANGTLTTGAAVTASLALVTKVETILGNNEVDMEEEDNLFFVASPAFRAYLRQIPEWTKGSYVEIKSLTGAIRSYYRQWGFNWIFHPKIVGKGTASEQCFAFHRAAIGHATNTGGMQALAGYHEEQDYSWARTSVFMGSKVLQNNGIVKVAHDGSAYVSS